MVQLHYLCCLDDTQRHVWGTPEWKSARTVRGFGELKALASMTLVQ